MQMCCTIVQKNRTNLWETMNEERQTHTRRERETEWEKYDQISRQNMQRYFGNGDTMIADYEILSLSKSHWLLQRFERCDVHWLARDASIHNTTIKISIQMTFWYRLFWLLLHLFIRSYALESRRTGCYMNIWTTYEYKHLNCFAKNKMLISFSTTKHFGFFLMSLSQHS